MFVTEIIVNEKDMPEIERLRAILLSRVRDDVRDNKVFKDIVEVRKERNLLKIYKEFVERLDT